MNEGLDMQDVNKLQATIANSINDLAIHVAACKGQDVEFEYGQISGLIAAADMLKRAVRGDL